MPRMARVVIAGVPHHVVQRGNRREKVFARKADRRRYLELLAEYSQAHGLAIHAYCLMPDHVHLVVVPRSTDSLAAALKPVHLRYSQEVNARTGVTGVLWQGRFLSCPLDEEHFWAATRHVECSPVRAGLVKRAEDYEWSSAAGHCGLRADELLADLPRPKWLKKWSAWLRAKEDDQLVEHLQLRTRTGRPAGNDEFVRRLERRVGRRLRALPVGRPPKRRKGSGK